VQQGLAAGEVIALISLDVQGAFDAAWWPAILNELRECECPKNLYELTKSYLFLPTYSVMVHEQPKDG